MINGESRTMRIITKILGSGYTTLVSAILAILVGIGFPELGKSFKPLSDIFLTLISISIIPIIFSSVTSSVVRMLSNKLEEITAQKIILIFTASLFVAGVIGLLTGIVMNPGEKVMSSEVITNMIFQDVQNSVDELSIFEPFSALQKFSFADFIASLLPINPFAAFAEGNIIQILSVSILIGGALAHLDEQKRNTALNSLGTLMQSFKGILRIPTKILPLGMFFLLSSNISKIKLNDLLAMKYFILSAVISFSVILMVAVLIIARYSPVGLKRSIIGIKESVIVAFSTCSNQATLPFLIASLRDKFKLPEQAVDLAIPLGITMCRVSNVAYYAFVSIFIASVYNQPLSIYEQGFIILGAVMTSFGASGVIAISMISIILDPLNLPMDSIILILVAVDPIVDPYRTVSSLIMNAAISCFIINKKRKRVPCD